MNFNFAQRPIVIGADHAGFPLKQELIHGLKKLGATEIMDLGTDSERPVDYPDFAESVALMVLKKQSEGLSECRGILICGSGVGAAIAANKLPGIRAGLCHDSYSAHQGVEHDDMNILVMGARVIGPELALELCEKFLSAEFDHIRRHQRRLEKIEALESKYFFNTFQSRITGQRSASWK